MKVKGLVWAKKKDVSVWFEKKYVKFVTKMMRKIEKLIIKADKKGLDLNDSHIQSIVGSMNTELKSYDATISFDGSTNTIAGVVNPEEKA